MRFVGSARLFLPVKYICGWSKVIIVFYPMGSVDKNVLFSPSLSISFFFFRCRHRSFAGTFLFCLLMFFFHLILVTFSRFCSLQRCVYRVTLKYFWNYCIWLFFFFLVDAGCSDLISLKTVLVFCGLQNVLAFALIVVS